MSENWLPNLIDTLEQQILAEHIDDPVVLAMPDSAFCRWMNEQIVTRKRRGAVLKPYTLNGVPVSRDEAKAALGLTQGQIRLYVRAHGTQELSGLQNKTPSLSSREIGERIGRSARYVRRLRHLYSDENILTQCTQPNKS